MPDNIILLSNSQFNQVWMMEKLKFGYGTGNGNNYAQERNYVGRNNIQVRYTMGSGKV